MGASKSLTSFPRVCGDNAFVYGPLGRCARHGFGRKSDARGGAARSQIIRQLRGRKAKILGSERQA